MAQLRFKGKWFQILAVALAFTVSFFVGKGIAGWGKPDVAVADKKSAMENSEDLPVNRLNVLLMGIDARPGEKDARSDSLIVISIDRATKKIAMVSIPRDSLVDIPGHGKNKINSANALGGAELARTTVEDLLGIEIPYYVKTNFDGFKDIVDTLGGVDLDVEKRMYYPSENINLKPGQQKLDGSKALAYVRFRHDALGDISRTQRQQKFLTALAKETMQAKTIVKLPRLVPQLMDAVETNLGVGDAVFLARATSNLDPNNIVTATLPGSFFNYKGASYWKVDEAKTKIVLTEMFDGLKVATISGPDINVPVDKQTTTKPKTQPQQSWVQINPVGKEADQNQGKHSSDITDKNPDRDNSQEDNTVQQPGWQPPSTPSGGQGTENTGNPTVPPDANSGQSGQVYNQVPGTSSGGNSQPPTGTGAPGAGQSNPPANTGTTPSTGSTEGTSQTKQGSNGTSGNGTASSDTTTPKVDNVNQG